MSVLFLFLFALFVNGGSSMCTAPGHADVFAGASRGINVISNSAPVPRCIQCTESSPPFNIVTDPSEVTYIDNNGGTIMNGSLDGIIIFDDGLLIEDPASSFSNGESVQCQFAGGQYIITFNIFVFSPPSLTPNVPVLDYDERDNVTLTCTGDIGVPNDIYQWTLPDGSKEPDNAINADAGLPLELKNVTRTDSGVYTCTGSVSVAGQTVEVESNVTLNIQFTAKIFSFTTNDTILPVMDTVTLNCSYEGNPTPNTIWTHNDTVLDPQSNTNLLETINNGHTLLEITFTSINDSGNYSCGVNNTVGNDPSGLIAVIAQVAPGPVATLSNGSSTTQSIDILWSFGFNGNSPITGVEISYSAVSNFGAGLGGEASGTASTDNPATTTFTIFDLQPLTTYEVNVTVRNEVSGTVGVSSVESVEATTQPLVPNKPAVTAVEPINSTALRIAWNASIEPYTQTAIERFGIFYNIEGNSTIMSIPLDDSSLQMLEIGNLLKGTRYQVRIVSENNAGPSPQSDINSGRTDIDPPSAVRNLQPTSNPFSICVQWQEPEDNGGQNISGYDLYLWNRNENEMENYVFVTSVGATVLTYTIENLDNDTEYNIRVAAKNDESGQGENSTTNATTGQPLQVDPMFIVNVTDITALSARVTWRVDGDSNIQFRLQFTTAEDEFDPGMYTNLTSTTFSRTISRLEPKTDYMVRMTRIEGGGCTRRVSETRTFTTLELEVEVEGPQSDVMAGDPVVLVCKLNTGGNATDVQWSHDGNPISNDDSGFMIRNHTLTIPNPTVNDTGNYSCTSRNGTRDEATFTFFLLIDPIPPVVVEPSPSPNDTAPSPTSEPIGSPFPLWAIIVVAVGAFLCFLFFVIMVIICLYCCCKDKSDKESPARYDLGKPAKSSGMWLDQGASGFSSVIPTSPEGDAPVGRGRTMTNDYVSATSFNTIDKKGSTDKLYEEEPTGGVHSDV